MSQGPQNTKYPMSLSDTITTADLIGQSFFLDLRKKGKSIYVNQAFN